MKVLGFFIVDAGDLNTRKTRGMSNALSTAVQGGIHHFLTVRADTGAMRHKPIIECVVVQRNAEYALVRILDKHIDADERVLLITVK